MKPLDLTTQKGRNQYAKSDAEKKAKQVGTMKAIVNPFTREVKLIHKVGKYTYELALYFTELDEWQGFDGVDKQYDMHFYYEDSGGEGGAGFDLSVYPVVNNTADTQNAVKVDVKIVYETLAERKPITYICPKHKNK